MFRFTIRDVLWLIIAMMAMGVGWLLGAQANKAYWREWSRKNDEWASDGFQAAEEFAAEVKRLRARVAELEKSAETNP